MVLLFLSSFWVACSPARPLAASPNGQDILHVPGISSSQVGICLYDPASAKYLYDYQGDRYFIPASNTKLFSLYAGLKYLGDSLVGMRYRMTDSTLLVLPSGDPSFLHPAFSVQPVFDLMKNAGRDIRFVDNNWKDNALGRGWTWDDYNDDYAAERSPFPIYGNMIRWVQERQAGKQDEQFGSSASIYSVPDIDWPVRFTTDTSQKAFSVRRQKNQNVYELTEGKEQHRQVSVPFITDGLSSVAFLMKDTLGRSAAVTHLRNMQASDWTVVHSRPVDSLFRPMMFNSDNFFAEQTLLMVANEKLGFLKDAAIIDTLLNNDLNGLPQRPVWVDGSGLSRNDLFSPRDFIYILGKLKDEFGLERMKRILPTGGTGTLASYYKQDSSFIYAKTGSLSGVIALSGYLITQKEHLLFFSVLVNNYTGNGGALRREIEKWIHQVRANR